MRAVRALVGPIFVVAGALHFTRTRWYEYETMMPDYLRRTAPWSTPAARPRWRAAPG